MKDLQVFVIEINFLVVQLFRGCWNVFFKVLDKLYFGYFNFTRKVECLLDYFGFVDDIY